MPIQPLRKKINKEIHILTKYQSGEINIVHTGREHIDDTLTGWLPGDITVIAGASGMGKTFELQTLRENVMDKKLNKDAGDYIWVDYSFEMKTFNIVLRGVSKTLDKSKKDVLLTQFSKEEQDLVKRYVETFADDRFYIEEIPLTPKAWYEQTREFLLANKDKKAVFIAIDHIALMKNDRGGKKDTVDATVEYVNLLKREFSNAYFIILSQLNRTILGRIADRDINSQPNRGDVYQSDTMFHIADYLIIVHNPHRLGISQYLKVNPRIYSDLEEFFCETEGFSKKRSFETLGNIFFHVLKVREGEIVFRDIYIEEIKSENLALYKEEIIDVAEEEEEEFDDLDFEGDNTF